MQVVLKAGKIDFFVSSLPKILFVPFYFDKEVQCSKVQILTFNKPTIIKKNIVTGSNCPPLWVTLDPIAVIISNFKKFSFKDTIHSV